MKKPTAAVTVRKPVAIAAPPNTTDAPNDALWCEAMASSKGPRLSVDALSWLADEFPCNLVELRPWTDVLTGIAQVALRVAKMRDTRLTKPERELLAFAADVRAMAATLSAFREGRSPYSKHASILLATHEAVGNLGKFGRITSGLGAAVDSVTALETLTNDAANPILRPARGRKPKGRPYDAAVYQLVRWFAMAAPGESFPRSRPQTYQLRRGISRKTTSHPFSRFIVAFVWIVFSEHITEGQAFDALVRMRSQIKLYSK